MPRITHDVFGPGSNVKGRIFRDYNELVEKLTACRQLRLKVVLTSGTFDFAHTGHYRYLEKARQRGDFLIVGVDSDKKVKKSKGPHRPMVDQEERMEILCHCRHVDVVFLKRAEDPKWHLIKTVQPDVLIVSKREYQEDDLVGFRDCCKKIVFLESQATTSTTAKIRLVLISPVKEIKERLGKTMKEVYEFLDSLTGGVE
ncbi:MAG: hypothetical protein D4S01_00170 [Dehalococcoidia bacterium]|nr:MAG: hypothetical protein D4S01_00170 [Dehalococcoidia bacterium]